MSAGVARETRGDRGQGTGDRILGRNHQGSPDVSRETGPGPLGRLVLLPIRGYSRFISPLFAPRCRYYPSCSAYAEQSIRELGAVRGTILATWRVLRCNPFSDGGFDHVADRRLFKPDGDA